jgi:DNA-binding HxlR family transcriptional regulator
MKKDVNWDEFSFIYRGKHRKRILSLLSKPKTPTQLKEETKLHFNIVSRTLIELEKKGFVKCVNPKQKMARFYNITEKGKKILTELQ